MQAHKNQLYYLSIPTLLILAESICRDLANNTELYGKHKPGSYKAHRPCTDDLFDTLDDVNILEEVLFSPLRKKTNLTISNRSPSDAQKTLLNRHLIIHGQSDAYGSKSNSLKAISLVYYVFYTLDYLLERNA
ncbi:hypothetical protein A6E13_19085 [Aliivibrio fischeri]|uniref:hypothetical protein n=1 Tax=Aliivibrio fischeri TaxID=668 RepID=UPI00080EC91C|nr:hypothetical protein [Aliivibrio fischeri]OCH29968.1 hypothetical protein A6E13_19085 [Aliivibrio fischeri]